MEKLTELYYERFLQHVVDAYTPILKGAKAGHCMKITGLPPEQLGRLYSMLQGVNETVDVAILTDEATGMECVNYKGAEYITATKLIEKRNDPSKAILILVPSNSG